MQEAGEPHAVGMKKQTEPCFRILAAVDLMKMGLGMLRDALEAPEVAAFRERMGPVRTHDDLELIDETIFVYQCDTSEYIRELRHQGAARKGSDR